MTEWQTVLVAPEYMTLFFRDPLMNTPVPKYMVFSLRVSFPEAERRLFCPPGYRGSVPLWARHPRTPWAFFRGVRIWICHYPQGQTFDRCVYESCSCE